MGMCVLMDWKGCSPLLRDDVVWGHSFLSQEGVVDRSRLAVRRPSLPSCGGFGKSPLSPAHLAPG
jgi:hypothetical protein